MSENTATDREWELEKARERTDSMLDSYRDALNDPLVSLPKVAAHRAAWTKARQRESDLAALAGRPDRVASAIEERVTYVGVPSDVLEAALQHARAETDEHVAHVKEAIREKTSIQVVSAQKAMVTKSYNREILIAAALGTGARDHPLGTKGLAPGTTQIDARALTGTGVMAPDIEMGYSQRTPFDGGVGRPYAPADQQTSEREFAAFSIDAAKMVHARAVHASTQNDFARFLETRDIQPRSPTAAEPSYDVAWEYEGTIYVGEVKSLPEGSETAQLRLGLGQTLHYRQGMRQRFPDRSVKAAMIVDRRPPFDFEGWCALCADVDVALIWADAERVFQSEEPLFDRS